MLSSARAISRTVQPSPLLCEETDVFVNLEVKGIVGHVQCSFLNFFLVRLLSCIFKKR